MYSQKEIMKIVLNKTKMIRHCLKLDDWDIDITVTHSKNKKVLAYLGQKFKTVAGVTLFPDTDIPKAEIFIFYNNHWSKKDAFGTLVHELLHVRFREISRLFGNKKPYLVKYNTEERFVSDMETLFICCPRINYEKN